MTSPLSSSDPIYQETTRFKQPIISMIIAGTLVNLVYQTKAILTLEGINWFPFLVSYVLCFAIIALTSANTVKRQHLANQKVRYVEPVNPNIFEIKPAFDKLSEITKILLKTQRT